MRTLIALRLSVCLCALSWLAGCGLVRRPKPPVTPLCAAQVIEQPVPAYRPLPRALTAPLPEPPAPPAHCRADGKPTPCALDALLSIEQWRGVLEQANADRATAAAVTAPAPAPASTAGQP